MHKLLTTITLLFTLSFFTAVSTASAWTPKPDPWPDHGWSTDQKWFDSLSKKEFKEFKDSVRWRSSGIVGTYEQLKQSSDSWKTDQVRIWMPVAPGVDRHLEAFCKAFASKGNSFHGGMLGQSAREFLYGKCLEFPKLAEGMLEDDVPTVNHKLAQLAADYYVDAKMTSRGSDADEDQLGKYEVVFEGVYPDYKTPPVPGKYELVFKRAQPDESRPTEVWVMAAFVDYTEPKDAVGPGHLARKITATRHHGHLDRATGIVKVLPFKAPRSSTLESKKRWNYSVNVYLDYFSKYLLLKRNPSAFKARYYDYYEANLAGK